MKGVPKKVGRRKQCGSRLVVKVHITDHVLSFTESRNRAVQEDRHQAWWTRLCLRPSYSSSRRCTPSRCNAHNTGIPSRVYLSCETGFFPNAPPPTSSLGQRLHTFPFSSHSVVFCHTSFPVVRLLFRTFSVVISFSGRSFAFLSSSSSPIFCSVQLCFTSVVTSFPQLLLPTLSSTLLGC